MNARRVHELFRRNWPPFSAVDADWENLLPSPAPDPARIESFVRRFICSPTVLVHVHRKIGGEFELSEAVRFLCPHIGRYQIRLARRDFSALVVIATAGVAAGVLARETEAVENAG
jgi:hypothetical protein